MCYKNEILLEPKVKYLLYFLNPKEIVFILAPEPFLMTLQDPSFTFRTIGKTTINFIFL